MPQLGPLPAKAPRGPEPPGAFQETVMFLGFARLVALPLALGWTLVLAVCDWLELSQVWSAAGLACVVAASVAGWASLWPRRYMAWSPERGWFDPREARE